MTDKERLEEIDKRAKHRVLENNRGEVRYRFTEINTEDYEWLIKQAERAQKNAQDLENMDRQLYREQQQNKRYREYLELIRLTGTHGKDISTGKILRTDEANLADEALEGDSDA